MPLLIVTGALLVVTKLLGTSALTNSNSKNLIRIVDFASLCRASQILHFSPHLVLPKRTRMWRGPKDGGPTVDQHGQTDQGIKSSSSRMAWRRPRLRWDCPLWGTKRKLICFFFYILVSLGDSRLSEAEVSWKRTRVRGSPGAISLKIKGG